MTESTPVGWEVDGTPLQTYCQNVTSLAPKWSTPDLRGDDTTLAYRRGVMWRPKTAAARDLTLGMWVTGMMPDGSAPPNGMERQFGENMNALRLLFWNDGSRQIVLTKKWLDPATGAVIAADALVEAGPLQPEMRGPHSARMTVDLLMSEPYFYGAQVTQTLAIDTPTVLDVPGDAPTEKILLTFDGQLTTPILTNSSPAPDVWVKVGSAIALADSVDLDVAEFTAIRSSDGASLIGAVTRSGARNWMVLWPGSNTLELTATAGAGSVDVTYAPAYL